MSRIEHISSVLSAKGALPSRGGLPGASIPIQGFMKELRSLCEARRDHAAAHPEKGYMVKGNYEHVVRQLDNSEKNRGIRRYAQMQLAEGADRCDLMEQIISEYLLPQERSARKEYDPYDRLWAQSPVMNARPLTDLVLSKMADGVPGFKVADVAFEHKMLAKHVESQLRAYMERRGLERADEVAQGTARKMRFEHSIEYLPEVFFDFNPYKPRLTGAGDCAVVALAIAENKTYSVAVADVSDITQEGGGVKTIDFKEYLLSRCFVDEPVDSGVSLESFWNSDVIDVKDSGVITVSLEGEGLHAIGFREGRMYVPDPIVVSQLYASAEVQDVWFNTSDASVAMARALKQAPQTPESIREDLTLADLEALETRLVNEIVSSISAQLGIENIHEVV